MPYAVDRNAMLRDGRAGKAGARADGGRNVCAGINADHSGQRTSGCGGASESSDGGSGLRRHQAAFERRVRDLHLLSERLETLKRGRFEVQGRAVSCPGYGRDCAAFFRHMEECGPDYYVSHGCLPPDALTGFPGKGFMLRMGFAAERPRQVAGRQPVSG
jgi:hypothetical protein